MRIGFSTGSIAQGELERGLGVATHQRAKAVELSALREEELDPVLESLDRIADQLTFFEHVSFHAPSKRTDMDERTFVSKLKTVAERGWLVIIHPDVIGDYGLWEDMAEKACIENMDKRKPIGRNVRELNEVFKKLPDATFCFDIGHARQVDPTMQEADAMLVAFSDRLRQVHMSFVNTRSRHERLNRESIMAFKKVAHRIDDSIPVILETPVKSDEVEHELDAARTVFA